MPQNRVTRPVVRGKLSTRSGTATGEGHDGTTARSGGAGTSRLGNSRSTGIVRDQRRAATASATTTGVPLRDVLGRVHTDVYAGRPDHLRQPAEPGRRARRPGRCRRSGGSGGSRPSGARSGGAGSGGPGTGWTGSPIGRRFPAQRT